MSDISKVTMEAYETEGATGYIIAPESEMKKEVIPSPPTIKMMPINPRDAVIYLTEEEITPQTANIDQLKAYAVDNKAVLICPKDRKEKELVATAKYVEANAKTLNVKKDGLSVKTDSAMLELGNELVDSLTDEDMEVEDAEIINL